MLCLIERRSRKTVDHFVNDPILRFFHLFGNSSMHQFQGHCQFLSKNYLPLGCNGLGFSERRDSWDHKANKA